MAAWFIDRMLPGLASGAVMTLGVAVSHVMLRRHVTRAINAQTRDLKGEADDGSRPA